VAIDEALACKETGEAKTILFNLSGHGHFDLASYDEYHSGKLPDYEYPDEKVQEALKTLPKSLSKAILTTGLFSPLFSGKRAAFYA